MYAQSNLNSHVGSTIPCEPSFISLESSSFVNPSFRRRRSFRRVR